MPKIFYSSVIPWSIDRVWSIILATSTNFHPGIRKFATALLKAAARAMRWAVSGACT